MSAGLWVILGVCAFATFMSGISATEQRKNEWAYVVAVAFFALPFYLVFDWALA